MSTAKTQMYSELMVLPLTQRIAQTVQAYFALTKPRIQVMLLFTAACAMVVAAKGLPNLGLMAAALFGLALSTGGSAAVNMWYDRDIDVVMERTNDRPLPRGLVRPNRALAFGVSLIALSTVELAVFVNGLTAFLSLAGAIYYAVVYTMWLKRRTPQNIVIGGGAGAFPPLVGWAAATGRLDAAAWLMFAIIFLWTPPHFWALALYKNSDYQRAGIPMMPVVRGPRATKVQSLGYAVVLWGVSLCMWATGAVDIVYVGVAAVMGAAFAVVTGLMWREPDHEFTWAKRTFLFSLLYLPVLFVAMLVHVPH